MSSSRFDSSDGSEGVEPLDDFDRFDEFDDRIRNEFDRAFAVDEDPRQVLNQLTPAFGRARRIHRAKQTLVGAAASIVVVAGAGLAIDRLADTADDNTTIAAEPEPADDAAQESPLVTESSPALSVEPNDSSTTVDTTGQTDSSAPTTTVPVDQAVVTPSSSATTAVTAVPDPPSTTVIDSECGSITVAVIGDTVELIEVSPAAGYDVDDDDDSEDEDDESEDDDDESEDDDSEDSDSVDVRFEGGGEGCDIKVEVESGRLKVENERD